MKSDVDAAVRGGDAASGATTHVFQALQYLRKLCAHPRLVTTPAGKKNAAFGPEPRRRLAQVFGAARPVDCGVGTDPTAETDLEGGGRNPASGQGACSSSPS